ncbi:RTA1-domain-containing protein [Sarocladium strictum]
MTAFSSSLQEFPFSLLARQAGGTLNDLQTGCHDEVPGLEPWYGYVPSLAAGVTFSVIFGLLLLGHVFNATKPPRTHSIILAVSALTELIGWAARTWASKCPYNKAAFTMQIITLIIAPVFVTAAIYVLLGLVIGMRGHAYSLIKPRLYIYIFCTCDVIALLVQAAGAALASRAFDQGRDTSRGAHIVVGGVVFQLATMTVFATLFLIFLYRSRQVATSTPLLLMIASLWVSFLAVFIRSVFRCVQLVQGFKGHLSTTEAFFIALDGAVMSLAIAVFNFIRLPGTAGSRREKPPANLDGNTNTNTNTSTTT